MTQATHRLEINCETGEEQLIPLTEAEIADLERVVAQTKLEREAREAEEQAKADAKAAALAKLAALGLTEEEAAALAG